MAYTKEQMRVYSAKRRRENPDYYREIDRRRREKDPEPMRERRRKWYKNNKDKHRDYMLSYVYGISLEEYNDMLDLQGGVCAICGNQEVILDKKGERIMLAVDHDHETGAVRGLLCSYCNTAIGGFFDDSTLLRKAADYLDSHKATPKDRGRTVTISIDSEDSDTHIQLVLDI